MNASYEEGRIAYLQGKPISSNPYHPATERFSLWSEGWRTELDAALADCALDLDDDAQEMSGTN